MFAFLFFPAFCRWGLLLPAVFLPWFPAPWWWGVSLGGPAEAHTGMVMPLLCMFGPAIKRDRLRQYLVAARKSVDSICRKAD